MAAEVIQVEDAHEKFERDRKIFRLALNGVPAWQIAEQLHCSRQDVEAGVTRMCAGVTPELKARTVELNCERLNDLYQQWFMRARNGSYEALRGVISIMDRQSKFLGLDVLPQAAAVRDEKREPKSFEKIREAVYRIARGKVIEGEAVEIKDAKDG